jgi:hypothetical protein
MIHQNDESIPDYMDSYDPMIRPFAWKVLQAMTAAVDAENKRLHGQLAKIFAAISPMDAVEVWPFWAAESKVLAAEWNDLRTAILQARTDQQDDAHPVEGQDQPAQANPEEMALWEAAEPVQESQPEADQGSAEAPAKPKRTYRKIEYVPGQNPFREGSKNARIFDLLMAGGRTKEQIAEESGADLKSVGYVLWLLSGPNQIPIHHDKASKTYKLA